MSNPYIKNAIVNTNNVIPYICGLISIFKAGIIGSPIICPIAIYNNITARIPNIIKYIFSFLCLFSSACGLYIPKLLKPAFFTNSSSFFLSILVSSYSIKAFAITKFTLAFCIPSCLFRYFSNPFEQALQVIPPIANTIFFIFLVGPPYIFIYIIFSIWLQKILHILHLGIHIEFL